MITFIIIVAILWFMMLFLDTIFQTCMFHPYIKFLHVSGLHIKPLFISLHVTHFNRFFNKLGKWRPMLLKTWFNIGACVSCIILIPCVVICFLSLYQMFKSSSIEEYDKSLLLPVIPGYNVPSSHFLYYIIVILLSSTIHEFGHALAASRENVSIEDFGFTLCAVFSFAFVNLRSEQFHQLSLWEQLRILCAGIWHNIVLSIFALSLWSSIYIILSPVYHVGNGVSVLEIHQLSGLNHPSGLQVGDHVFELGNCQIQNQNSWKTCLQKLSTKSSQGFCIPEDSTYEKMKSDNEGKCMNSSEYLVFYTKENKNKRICLKVREAVEYFILCNNTSDCRKKFCFVPDLPSELHHFIPIKRHHKPPVLYVGSVSELAFDIHMSDFVPKFQLCTANYGEAVVTLLQYIIMFSSGLAVLNVLPGCFLDGKYIIENLIHMCLKNYVTNYGYRNYIVNIINKLGFLMLLGICLSSLKYFIFSL